MLYNDIVIAILERIYVINAKLSDAGYKNKCYAMICYVMIS